MLWQKQKTWTLSVIMLSESFLYSWGKGMSKESVQGVHGSKGVALSICITWGSRTQDTCRRIHSMQRLVESVAKALQQRCYINKPIIYSMRRWSIYHCSKAVMQCEIYIYMLCLYWCNFQLLLAYLIDKTMDNIQATGPAGAYSEDMLPSCHPERCSSCHFPQDNLRVETKSKNLVTSNWVMKVNVLAVAGESRSTAAGF